MTAWHYASEFHEGVAACGRRYGRRIYVTDGLSQVSCLACLNRLVARARSNLDLYETLRSRAIEKRGLLPAEPLQ